MKPIEKISEIRRLMKNDNVDCLLVVTDDYHQSEYVGDFFKSRAWLSGFTGSAGTLVIFADEAKLFTDGRYYIQAAKQLEGSGIDLMKYGTEGVPSPSEYIATKLKAGDTLAFDGRCVSARTAEELAKKLPGVNICVDKDYPGMIWLDRPAIPSAKIWELPLEYAGRSHADKLADLRAELKKADCSALVMSSLCDIAWLYNLRGSDVEDTPVFLSYCIVSEDKDILFANKSAAAEVAPMLEAENVTLRGYDEFYSALTELNGRVMLDKAAVNSAIIDSLTGCEIVDHKNPTEYAKAVKNETEIKNVRLCHVADGLAVTKLMLELKYGNREFDECTVDDYLVSLRRECAERLGVHFLGESFGAICAFGPNGAIIHYSASRDTAAKIDRSAPVPMLMIDSGGQYLEGTTDITRTFALGEIPANVKRDYTIVATAMLRLLNAVFMDGCAGSSLDILCRGPFWERGIDYRHGTGHGVGYLNSVHEGPNRFHYRTGDKKLEAGMITTDEPGIYIEGSHGVRIENELLCVKAEHNEWGQFMRFENLTFCPIDPDAIDVSVFTAEDRVKYNNYQKSVFDKLSPYLCENDREKLAYITREI